MTTNTAQLLNTQVCPLLSMRNPEIHELCIGESCALYLPNVNRCSLVYIGYKAFAELQHMQAKAPPPSS